MLGDQLPDVVEDVGAGLDVQPDGRLVKQQQTWPMQQGASDFQPPHLAAGEVANLAAGAVGKPDAREHLIAAQARFGRRVAAAVQRLEIGTFDEDASNGLLLRSSETVSRLSTASCSR